MSIIARVADFWIGRKRVSDPAALAAARAEVSGLKPIVLVIGGSRGIGPALAERFARGGADVAIVARTPELLNAVASGLAANTGRRPLVLVRDVTQEGAAEAIGEDVRRAGYYVDVLINNAGMGLAGPFLSHDPKSIAALLALDIETPTRLMRHFLPGMCARRHGGVLNVASLGGAVPGPNQASYYASKAYVLSLTEAVANEIAGLGVRVCALAPGPVDTGFHEDMGAERSLYRRILPATSPQHVARTAYFGFTLGQRVIVPGLVNAAGYALLRLLPHPITVPLMAVLLKRRA